MSPDRTTITRAEAIRRRKEDDVKHKSVGSQKGTSKLRSVSAPKPEAPARSSARGDRRGSMATLTPGRLRHRYDIAMSSPYGRPRGGIASNLPRVSISMPKIHFGPRLFSFFIVVFCILDLFTMFKMDPFIVHKTQVFGNSRITAQEIESAAGAVDQPAAFVNPLQLEHNIRIAFQDVQDVQVDINLPAQVTVKIVERKPVVEWNENGKILWIDAQGVSFPARGQVAGLVTINANGAPPAPLVPNPDATAANTDPVKANQPVVYLNSDLEDEIKALSTYLPTGTTLVFDPKYGIGWSDPKGWKVYFGHSSGDTSLKLHVYQAMIDYMTKNNIQPVIISVEYPNAPFYRLEQ